MCCKFTSSPWLYVTSNCMLFINIIPFQSSLSVRDVISLSNSQVLVLFLFPTLKQNVKFPSRLETQKTQSKFLGKSIFPSFSQTFLGYLCEMGYQILPWIVVWIRKRMQICSLANFDFVQGDQRNLKRKKTQKTKTRESWDAQWISVGKYIANFRKPAPWY